MENEIVPGDQVKAITACLDRIRKHIEAAAQPEIPYDIDRNIMLARAYDKRDDCLRAIRTEAENIQMFCNPFMFYNLSSTFS